MRRHWQVGACNCRSGLKAHWCDVASRAAIIGSASASDGPAGGLVDLSPADPGLYKVENEIVVPHDGVTDDEAAPTSRTTISNPETILAWA